MGKWRSGDTIIFWAKRFSFWPFLNVFLLLLVTVLSKVNHDLIEVETILFSKECRMSVTAVTLGSLAGSV